ncbi:hypothetical protein LA6_002494 [Marinibacterium anthonyi]|nr:hypothetical protein LA6_002494 [Marinibacterium anthonyi]
MSYADATAFAASLATSLMVVIVVFQAGTEPTVPCPPTSSTATKTW